MNLQKFFPYGTKRREFAKKIVKKLSKTQFIYKDPDYLKWIEKNEPIKKELEKQRKIKFEYNPKISIVVPMYNTKRIFFEDIYNCMINQTYSNWELCLADGSPEKIEYIDEYLKKENRIKYKFIGENKGISGNTNEALTLVTGDYIGLLDHDDVLPVFSIFEVVKSINENPGVEFLYSDEDKIEKVGGERYGVFFKPDFSKFTLRSANYICHFSVFKKELMDKLKGFKSKYDGSQDFDIVIRASEETNKIVHIPKVLYHWRVHPDSTAGNSDSKPYAFEVAKNVIEDHLKRTNIKVNVEHGLTWGSYEVEYQPKREEKIIVFVDAVNSTEKELEKILKEIEKSTYNNKEIIILTNNLETQKYKTIKTDNVKQTINSKIEKINGEYFIIVDKSLIEINKENWLEQLLGICQDEDVSVVGTKLVNKQDLVEHCGIVVGMNGIGDFLYKSAPKDIGTYMQRLKIIHNVSAVYYRYSLIKKSEFIKNGKFSSDFTGLATSIDLCLNCLKNNNQVIINPMIEIKVKQLEDVQKINEEKFCKKWSMYLKEDKYFSPNLSKKNTGLSFNIE